MIMTQSIMRSWDKMQDIVYEINLCMKEQDICRMDMTDNEVVIMINTFDRVIDDVCSSYTSKENQNG